MSNFENPEESLKRSRRGWIQGLVAGLAGLTGAGLAWWQFKADTPEKTDPGKFWALEFDTPMASKLSMAAFRGRPLVLNFWATWCPPCIEELPLLDAFYRQNSSNGWQVLGLAIDKPGFVLAFLKHSPVSFPVAMAGFEGIDLSKSLGNFAGGLPFSVVLGGDGQVLKRKIGKISEQDLALWRELK
jgi:thiol-disulfide isomerase/thioredoxin